MNEYSEGSIETLAWILRNLKSCTSLEDYKKKHAVIEKMFQDLAYGTAQCFNDRLELFRVAAE